MAIHVVMRRALGLVTLVLGLTLIACTPTVSDKQTGEEEVVSKSDQQINEEDVVTPQGTQRRIRGYTFRLSPTSLGN